MRKSLLFMIIGALLIFNSESYAAIQSHHTYLTQNILPVMQKIANPQAHCSFIPIIKNHTGLDYSRHLQVLEEINRHFLI